MSSILRSMKHSKTWKPVYNLISGGEDTANPMQQRGWSKDLRRPNVNHVTVVIFLEFFAWGLVTTILPDAIKDFFGTGQMWLVLGLTQGMKGILAFFSAPVLGALSDAYGRKYFLLLTVACTCIPLPFLLCDNLWYYVIIVAISGSCAVTFSIVFAYVSDVTDADDRSAAFGQVSATFAASLVISPALGSWMESAYGEKSVYVLSTIIASLDVLYILFFVPESMQPDRRSSSNLTELLQDKLSWRKNNPCASMKGVFRTPLMLQLSLMVFFSYLPEAGEYQTLMLYLKSSIGFTEADLALFIAILGILSIISQTYFLGFLSTNCLAKNVIIVGLMFQTTQLAAFGLSTAKWLMFSNGVLAAAGSLTYPAISALVSQTAAPDQQGVVQGIVTGIRQLCTGLGPALFGLLFQLSEAPLEDNRSVLPHYASSFPGAPFLVGAGFVLVALFITINLPDRIAVNLIPSRPGSLRRGGSKSPSSDVADLLSNMDDNSEVIELTNYESPLTGSDMQPAAANTSSEGSSSMGKDGSNNNVAEAKL